MRNLVWIALLAALLGLAVTPASADECAFHAGQRVVLYSSEDDPSVLAWDSAQRLRDYHAASWDERKALEPHALDISPGTRAQVVSCRPKFVLSPTAEELGDAVGVLILTGPYHGSTRWVLGSDIRGIYHKMKQAQRRSARR